MTFDTISYVFKSPESPVAEHDDGDGVDESRTQGEVEIWTFCINDYG
jgi:hypothetical protein